MNKRLLLIPLAAVVFALPLAIHRRQPSPAIPVTASVPDARADNSPAKANHDVPQPAPRRNLTADKRMIDMPELPLSQDNLWEKASPAPAMASFQKWTADYQSLPEAEKTGAAAEGVSLATERRAALRAMIERDPEQALAHAVPEAVRRAMPAAVRSLLEEKVDARGDLIVTATTYENGREQGPAVRTEAKLNDGRKFNAFVYGNREYRPSRADVPVHGIALDGALAVSQWPGRVLEPVERAEAKQALGAEPVCPESKLPVTQTGTETAIIIGTDAEFFCGPAHARRTLALSAAEEAIRPPGLGARTRQAVDAASDGDTVPSPLAEADHDWTTGTKRILAVRVKFEQEDGSGYDEYHDLSVDNCKAIVAGIRSKLSDWSYDRFIVRLVESGGSAVTPVIGLNRPADHYDSEDIGDIWDEVQDKVPDVGYDPEDYDIILVLAGDAPIQAVDAFGSVTWGGMGRIGEGLSFIRKNDVDVQKRIDANISVSVHEIGHNLGLYHTSNIFTQIQIVDGVPIGALEYGDRYCRMGKGGEDYNVRYKQWLNWLDDGNVPLAVTDGVYTIREHDLEEKSGVRGLQVSVEPVFVALNSLKQLFVEYRQFDLELINGWPYVPYNRQLVAYGAQIRLAKPDSPKAWLLDTTPETPNWEPPIPNTDDNDTNGNIDAPLLPGRTFAYGRNGNTVYITNLNANPESGVLQIEVQHGPVSGNDPPAGSITTPSAQGGKNQNIVFTANVTDPDDSDLAYHWQIPFFNADDKPIFPAVFPNARNITVKFPETGTMLIRCIVSDKHGGTVTLTRNYTIVVNQHPTISAIADQEMDEDGTIQNLPFTVSDSTTPAGSLTVTATSSDTNLFPAGTIGLGTVSGGNRRISLTPADNRYGVAIISVKVSDGSLFDTEEFEVTVNPVTPGTALISSGGTWRYWDDDTAPPSDWKVPAFQDTAWLLNNSRFYYPSSLLAPGAWTLLATPTKPRTTCYFRKTFFLTASPVGSPTLKLLCDDGAVVYLNGLEVWRQNMPEGAISSKTRAESSVGSGKQLVWTQVPLSFSQFHLGGNNNFAVEVHDSGVASRGGNDVAFDFQLHLLQAPTVSNITDKFSPEDQLAGAFSFTATEAETPPAPLIYSGVSSNQAIVADADIKVNLNIFTFSRYITCMPQPNATGTTEITLKVSDGSSETWEKFNLTITPVNDAPYVTLVPDMAVAFNELAPLVEVQVGDIDSPVGSLTVTATSSNQAFLPNAGIQVMPGTAPNRRWLRMTPNAGVAAQATVTVNVNDGSLTGSDAFIFRTTMPFNPESSDITLVRSGETWRYWASALPRAPDGEPVDFTDSGLDDRAWPTGASQLGYDNTGEVTTIPATPYRITTYFRKKFTVPNRAAVSQLKMRLLRDDGAVVYLNGSAVWYSNMPHVRMTSGIVADSDIAGTAENTWQSLTLSIANLLSGSNTIAVEVHQRTMPTSLSPGDLSFDFELDAVPAATNSPDTLITQGEMWAYWDQPSYPDNSWRLASFAEDEWKYGLARLGYGIGGESTIVNDDNANGTQRNPAVLFRKAFDVADPAAYTALHLFTQRDDGIAIHLNGVRVHYENLSSIATLADLATAEVPAAEQTQWRHYLIDPKRLISGRNLIAVEIHQSSLSGTDLNFDLQLIGDLSGQPTLFLRPVGNDVELSWPAAYNEWTPVQSSNLELWNTIPAPRLLDAGWIYVIHPNPGPRKFYRLEKP